MKILLPSFSSSRILKKCIHIPPKQKSDRTYHILIDTKLKWLKLQNYIGIHCLYRFWSDKIRTSTLYVFFNYSKVVNRVLDLKSLLGTYEFQLLLIIYFDFARCQLLINEIVIQNSFHFTREILNDQFLEFQLMQLLKQKKALMFDKLTKRQDHLLIGG